MNDRTAVAIQNAAQVIERTAHVDVGNIDVPMLVGMRWLLETSTLARRLTLPSREQPGLLQYPPNAGGADRHDVSVQHHKRQSPIAFQGMFPWKRMIACFSQGASQKSRGIQPLCSLTRP